MAGLLYVSGFEVSTGGSNSMTLSTLGAGATIAKGYYMPGRYGAAADQSFATSRAEEDPGVASWTGQAYTDFSAAVITAFNTATGATWTCVLDVTNGKYTLTKTGGAVALTFSTAADIRLREALGFNADQGAATTFTSTRCADFCIFSTIAARTNVTGPFEPDDIAEESVTDGGDDYVWTRRTQERLMTWDQMMEPRTSVYPAAKYIAGVLGEWTWEDWFRHIRGTHPFVVYGDALVGEALGAYYRYTAKGASFRPRRFATDFDDYWVVPHEVRWLARRITP